MAVASLVLGIVAVVLSTAFCWTFVGPIIGIVCAIIGIPLGVIGKRSPYKKGLAMGGLVTSIIGLVFAILFLILFFVVISAAIHNGSYYYYYSY